MGKSKGCEARYNVLSLRVDDERARALDAIRPVGVSRSDYLRALLDRALGFSPAD